MKTAKEKPIKRPYEIEAEPVFTSYTSHVESFNLKCGDDISLEIINRLKARIESGCRVKFYTEHDQAYDKYEDCELNPHIHVFLYDEVRYKNAHKNWLIKKKKYDKDMTLYNEYIKQSKVDEEKKEKKKRYTEFLKLKEEFEKEKK